MRRAWRVVGGLILLTVAAVGCRRAPPEGVPVAGRVTCSGYPVAGGTVVFTPDASRGQQGKSFSARINDDGTYKLHDGSDERVPPGIYRITVAGPYPPTFGPRIAERYRDPDSSGLFVEVKPGLEYNLQLDQG